jgi:DNA-binding transcriptional ArsR family regulator
VTDIDRVIHEPARLLLVALLAGVREADFLWLQRESGLTKGNLSNHLAKLADAGYVEIEKTYKGRIPLTLLRLTRSGKQALDRYKKALNGVLAKTNT